jgi:hypothetical protein
MTLAKTMVVKSEVAAETINRELQSFGESLSSDPHTWKYYMNLAGLYHPTDTVMTVTSMDTLEEIEFTRDNLKIFRATASAYAYGSRYYRDLVARYPTQETLILGILNPIDINKALGAQDGDILYYDTTLVESQEVTLIPQLQRWIHAFMSRWTVPGYGFTDEYYPAGQLGVLFANLPLELLNLRLEACRTEEAHTFHIREYLASHAGLDAFLPQMTVKQALFLYRNVNYLQRNAGKQSTFKTLIQNIVSDRNLPLARYEMRHDETDQTDALRPKIEMFRQALNDHPGDGSTNRRTVDDVMSKQYPAARSNSDRHYEVLDDVVNTMVHSRSNRLPTKVLESALLDTTDSVPFAREEVFLNHWLYLASSNRFEAIVNVPDPTTGVSVALTAKEAFIVFLYAFNGARGVVLDTIPKVYANRVRKPTLPTTAQMLALVDPNRITEAQLAVLLEHQPPMGVYVSLAAYREFCQQVQFAQNYQRGVYAIPEYHLNRGMMEAAAAYCYRDMPCDLGVGQAYTEWFAERGLDFAQLGALDLDLLANNVITTVTGQEIGSASALAQLQDAMMQLMGRLSSYSVQYLTTINSTSYRILDTLMPRFSDIASVYHTAEPIDIHRIEPLTLGLSTSHKTLRRQAGVRPIRLNNSLGEGSVNVDLSMMFNITDNAVARYRVSLEGVSLLNQDSSNV